MNSKELRAQVEAKIRASVPESMEHDWQWLVCNEATLCFRCKEWKEEDNCSNVYQKCYGRPLNLQDVLIALGDNQDAKLELLGLPRIEYDENQDGEMVPVEITNEPLYDLTKPFLEQDDKLFKFLHPLLCT